MRTWQSVWESMTPGQRIDAAEALFLFLRRERPRAFTKEVIESLAEMSGTPAGRVEKMKPLEQADMLGAVAEPSTGLIHHMVVNFHLLRRRRLMRDLLDLLGLPHDDAVIPVGAKIDPPRAEAIEAAIEQLLADHPAENVELYLDTLEVTGKPWKNLRRAREHHRKVRAAADRQTENVPGSTIEALTELDKLITDALGASLGGTEGALNAADRRRMVEELARLNSHRHKSYFHLGFLDAVEGQALDASFPECNESRLGWYLAGALTGLFRAGRHERAAEVIDLHRGAAKSLGRTEHPAGSLVARMLFDALASNDRLGEVPELIDSVGVFNGGLGFLEALLFAATGLLRDQQPDPAGPLLDLCVEAAGLFEGHVGELPSGLRRDLDRRRAHFARLKARWDSAEALLSELLEREPGDREGMLLADRGLVKCRLRALTEVRLPKRRTELEAAAQSLARGEADFSAAARLEGRGGHGEYCLGVLELARGRTDEARPLLDRAVSAMERNPELYKRIGVLPRAQLYLGHCLAATLDRSRVARAGECLRAGLEQDRDEAPYLVREALGHIALSAPQRAAELMSELRPLLGDRALLDVALEGELLRQIPELRRDLVKRAAKKTRSPADRFADWEALLKAACAADDEPAGLEALDGAEELSQSRPEGDRFLAMLDDPKACGSFWTADELRFARIRLLEARGDTAAAAALLQEAAHRILTEEGAAGAREVAEYAARIAGYGIEPDASLVARVDALREALAAEPRRDGAVPRGAVLFIGGNETQQRYDDWIRKHFKERFPKVKLLLRHPGWGSNWAGVLKRMERDFDTARAVVLMRFVRTQFGRTVRRRCSEQGLRWHACTGHGRDSIRTAIEAAIGGLAEEPG